MKSDIEEVVSVLTGENKLKICCPFHNDKTPSLVLFPDTESWYCYGCGCSGDVHAFIMQYNNCNFIEAEHFFREVTGHIGKLLNEEIENPVGREFSVAINEEIKATTTASVDYRGIRGEVRKYFGVRHTLDAKGNVIKVFYPATAKEGISSLGGLSGYKIRQHPKTFLPPYGETGKECHLFGQWRASGKRGMVLIAGGEEDAMAAHQILSDARSEASRDRYDAIPCLSSLTGESGVAAMIQNNYEEITAFDKIIVCMDNDKAGKEAIEKIASVVPRGKLYVVTPRYKDVNAYIYDNATGTVLDKGREFVRDFWNMRQYVIDGVRAPVDGFNEILDDLHSAGISLPPYMHTLQEMMGGSLTRGYITNIIGASGEGKSTHVNRILHHLIINHPELKPTVVSLEATASQLMLELMSLHVGSNLLWKLSKQEVEEWLKSEEGKAVRDALCFADDGSPRFFIIDDRECDIGHTEKQMETLFRKEGSRLFVFDVLSDLLRGKNGDKSEDHMNFQKRMSKEGCTIINVLHTRKPKVVDGKQQKVTEYDALNTSSFVQSAHINIVLNRDKLAGDEVTKNSTEVDLAKCRRGKTGQAGKWYYDFKTTRCYDLQDWLADHQEEVNF